MVCSYVAMIHYLRGNEIVTIAYIRMTTDNLTIGVNDFDKCDYKS